MDEETKTLRDNVTKARQNFDEARNSKRRSEYDKLFNEVLIAINAFNSYRDRKIKDLGLDMM